MPDIQKVVAEAVFKDEMSAGMAAAAGAADKLNLAIDRQEASFRKAGPTAESLVRKLDSVTKAEAALEAATARAARQQEILQAGLAAGNVTADQMARSMATHAAEISKAEAALARARGAATATATAHQGLAKSTEQAAWQMKQLALQAPDVVQGLLGGQSAFQVLLQQGGQVVQVMGGVGAAVRGVASVVGSALASPAGVVTVAALALAGLGYAAESSERRMVGLQNALRATRSDYAALATTVNDTAKRMAATTNISTGDARESGTILAASSAFSGSGADLERNIRLARDLAAVMGTDMPQAATKLAAAMRDPGAAAQQLADGGFRSMSQALANSIKLQADAGDRAGAYARVVEAMGQTVDGAGEPQTRLQKALSGLSDAFTKAGQSGKSLAEEIGGVITSAASWAIERTTDFISTLQNLRDLLPRIVPNVTPGTSADARAGLPTVAQSYGNPTYGDVALGPVIPGRPINDNRAVGLMQVLPSTAAYYGLNPFDRSQNIEAGAREYAKWLRRGGSQDAALARYGGYGSDVAAAGVYIGNVRGADTSRLDASDVAALERWGTQLNLTPSDVEVLKRIAAWENRGRHTTGGGASVLPSSVTGSTPDGIGGYAASPGGALSTAAQARREDRLLADQAYAGSRNVLSARIADNSAQQQLMERGIAQAQGVADAARGRGDIVGAVDADATVSRLTQRLQELKGAASDLITEQQKLARSAEDSVAPLRAEEGATRDLAVIRQKYIETARRTGAPVDEDAVLREQTAKLTALSVAYYDNVDALNRKADADARVLPLLEQGGRAAEYAANREKAIEEARKMSLPNTAARRAAEDALTAALNRGTDAQIDRQAAVDVAGFARQLEYAQTELSLLTASTEKRAEELAILQERHKLGLRLGEQATEEQQKALDAAAAVARVGTELQRQKSGLEALSSGIIQIFDRVGDAITDAFVQGQGAAVNWGNVVKGIGTQVLSMFMRLGVVTPITNSLFGRNDGTLWSGLAALGGAGTTGGAASGGGIMDLLGLSSLLPKDGIMSALGLDGLFGATQTMTQSLSTGAATISGGLGSIFGAAGLGFGAGSLLNNMLGRQGAQATNGMIGAGVGSLAGVGAGLALDLAFPGVGTLVSILGGLAGGGIGGLFGPGESVKGYGYRLEAAPDGLLKMGTSFYNETGAAAFQEAAAGIAALNDWMGKFGITVGGASIVGGNKNGPDYSNATAGSFAEGVSQLYYHSSDADLERALSGRGNRFSSTDELQKLVEGFTAAKQVIEALTAEPVPAFTQQMTTLTEGFDAALAKAREYGLAEDKLTAARAKAVSELEAQRALTIRNTRDNLEIRRLAAGGDSLDADLARQALNARTELADFTKQMDALALSAADKASLLVDLEQTQAAERARIIADYGQQAADALRQAGGNIRAYLDSLASGTAAGASPADRLTAAQAQFTRDRTLAMGGDRDALGRITGTADALLAAGRDVYASGQGFQDIRTSIIDGLTNLPVVQSYDKMQTDALTAIQNAIETGTLNTSIVPTGNVVTLGSGSLAMAGVESKLAQSNTLLGWIIDTLGATSVQERTVLGWIVESLNQNGLQDRTVMGWIVDTVASTSEMEREVLGWIVNAIDRGFIAMATYGQQHSLYLAATNDNLLLGSRVATDVGNATTTSFAAMNTILVDSAGAITRATVDVNTSLGTVHVAILDLNTSLGTVDASVNAAAASIRSADTNATASFAAMNRILADSAGANTASLAALNTITVNASSAAVTSIAVTNQLLGQILEKIRMPGGVAGAPVVTAAANDDDANVAGRLADIGTILAQGNQYAAATAWNTRLLAGPGGIAMSGAPAANNTTPPAPMPTIAMPGGGLTAGDLVPLVDALNRTLEAVRAVEAALRQVGTAQAVEVREAGAATVDAVKTLTTTIERKVAVR